MRSVVALFISIALLAGQVHAAYNHPAPLWSDMSVTESREIERSAFVSKANLLEPTFTEEDLARVLQDSEKRIDPEFKIPKEIQNSVAFWLRIYTQLSTQQMAVFDSKHPEIIYEVLDFRPIAEKAKSRLVYEVIVKNRVSATINAYKKAFAHLAKNSRPKKPTREENNILTALKKTQHRHSFSEFGKHLRTQTGQRDNIIKGLANAEPFFPKMEQIFAQLGLPTQLVRLTLVESSFNLDAISRVGASGIWQFMPASGKEYLMIDEKSDIDERLSPLKATVAAGKLLKRNFRLLKNWALAITSYNHGMTHLRQVATQKEKAIPFKKVAHLFELCSKKSSKVGWASKNYYSEFLAILHAETYRHILYGNFSNLPEVRPVTYQRIGKAQTAVQFSMNHGIALHEFMRINPDVGNPRKVLPKDFLVAVPTFHDDLLPLVEIRNKNLLLSRTTPVSGAAKEATKGIQR